AAFPVEVLDPQEGGADQNCRREQANRESSPVIFQERETSLTGLAKWTDFGGALDGLGTHQTAFGCRRMVHCISFLHEPAVSAGSEVRQSAGTPLACEFRALFRL